MIEQFQLYGISTALMMVVWPVLWRMRKLTILKMIILLFALDIVLTVEAALYSNIVLIAVLHIITIPALIGLIYFDLVNQHKTQFKCFVCGKLIQAVEEMETVNRTIEGKPTRVIVHTSCIHLENKERKGISSRVFRKGIPK